MPFAYGNENRWHDQYFTKNSGAGTYGPLPAGDTNGALAVTVAANGPVTASASTLKLLAADTEDGSYQAISPDITVSITGTYEDGDIMAQLIVPNNIPKFLKATLDTGTSLSGNVDIYTQYLAR